VNTDSRERELLVRFLSDPVEQHYAELFDVLYPRVYGFLRSRMRQPEVAEDLAQDVMVAVYRRSRDLRNPELFYGWLFRIARNALLQHLRRERRRARLDQAHEEHCGTTHHHVVPESPGGALSEWLALLTPAEGEILALRYVDGLEYQEIAHVLDIPMGTVKWRLFAAKNRLANLAGSQVRRSK
jgi:RNA polymerase sigma-70 factor (ECF subfamily)